MEENKDNNKIPQISEEQIDRCFKEFDEALAKNDEKELEEYWGSLERDNEKSSSAPREEKLEEKEFITLKELLESNIPEQEYYIEKILPKRSVILIAGKPGDFKSFLAMHIAKCLITGTDFLNLKTRK